MTTSQHYAAHDRAHAARVNRARGLYAAADAMHERAVKHYRDAVRYADADEWDEADAAMQAARHSEAMAAQLTAEADAS
jgi:hypothetical protein